MLKRFPSCILNWDDILHPVWNSALRCIALRIVRILLFLSQTSLTSESFCFEHCFSVFHCGFISLTSQNLSHPLRLVIFVNYASEDTHICTHIHVYMVNGITFGLISIANMNFTYNISHTISFVIMF